MKTFVPILAVIVIVASGAYMMFYYGSQEEPGRAVAHKAPVACEGCSKAYITMLSDQPAECFYCGEQKVWRARQCSKCGAIIPIVGGPKHGGAQPKCPSCGPTQLKEVSPDGLEEH